MCDIVEVLDPEISMYIEYKFLDMCNLKIKMNKAIVVVSERKALAHRTPNTADMSRHFG